MTRFTILDDNSVANFYMTGYGNVRIEADDTAVGGVWIRTGETAGETAICIPNLRLRFETWNSSHCFLFESEN